MLSRMIDDRVRREEVLRAGLREHHEVTVRALAEQMAPYVEEGEDLAASVDCLLRVLERRLSGHRRELVQVESQHDATNDLLGKLRRERDEAAGHLHREYVQLRTATAGFLGREASNRLLALEGPTAPAHHPIKLSAQVKGTLARLESRETKIPPPRLPNLPELTEEWRQSTIESLKAARDRLEEALDKVKAKQSKSSDTKDEKDDRMALYDRELSAIANLQESLLVLGMKLDLARTVWQKQRPAGRPRRRKRRGATKRRPKQTTKTTTREASSKEVSASQKSQKMTPKTLAEPVNPKKSSGRPS